MTTPNKDDIHKFEKEIERISTEKRLPIIESITHYCMMTGLEVESCAKLVSRSLKMKIASEAASLHLIKRTGRRLPI